MITDQEAYLNDHPSNISAQAVLAALYSSRPTAEGSNFTSSLPSISSFTKTVDVNQLESQGIQTGAVLVAKSKAVAQPRTGKRRIRGGKTFDQSNDIDPERWLPMRERSYYKPSKSRKRKTGGATQGGVMNGEGTERSGSGQVDTKKSESGGRKKKNRK